MTQTSADPELDRVVQKIAKLLRLAEGASNSNEAAVAAARATELLERHHLDRATIERAQEVPEEKPNFDKPLFEGTGAPPWRDTLITRVAVAHGCRAIYQVGIYEKKHGRWLTMIGRSSDLMVARYVYTYLVREIDRLVATAAEAGTILGQDAEWSFRYGVVETVTARLLLTRERARTGYSTRAIVRADERDKALEDFVKKACKNLVDPPRRYAGSDWMAKMEGRLAGESIVLNTAIEGGRVPGRIGGRR